MFGGGGRVLGIIGLPEHSGSVKTLMLPIDIVAVVVVVTANPDEVEGRGKPWYGLHRTAN
jgi:hypothetical protein